MVKTESLTRTSATVCPPDWYTFKSATRWALAATIPTVITLWVAAADVLAAFGPRYEGGETALRILLAGQQTGAREEGGQCLKGPPPVRTSRPFMVAAAHPKPPGWPQSITAIRAVRPTAERP